MSKEIQLTHGKVVIVDDADFEWLNQWRWYAVKGGHTWYAKRSICNGKTSKPISMHRQILGLTFNDGQETDHKNHNGLDNQRHNLRPCTPSQNQHNQRPKKDGTSKYKGVSWHTRDARWTVAIEVNDKTIYLGRFRSEKTAALAYDKAVKKYFGEFACTNF